MPRSANPRPFINRAVVQRGIREDRARRMRDIGRTRWGQAWLGSLHAVDEGSRLGRGLAYARQGAVESIEFGERGRVRAHVRGSRRGGYTVELTLKPFTRPQERALVEEIARRPEWLDLLLAGQLPTGIEAALAKARVRLFPESFRDLGMACSCPDAAVPCKHVAAALYRLAQYIDDDPTILFSVRGLDLARTLGTLGDASGLAPASIESLKQRTPPPPPTHDDFTDDLLPPAAPQATAPRRAAPQATASPSAAPQAPFLSFWQLLLPKRPAFFDGGDLADLYLRYLTAASAFWRASPGILDGEPDADSGARVAQFGDYPFQSWQVARCQVILDAAGGFLQADVLDRDGGLLHTLTKEVALVAFVERHERQLPVWTQAYRLARRLVVLGGVMPRLLRLEGNGYRVRWQAAVQDEAVANAVRALGSAADLTGSLRYRETAREDDDIPEETDEQYLRRLGEELAAEMDGAAPSAPEPEPATRDIAPAPSDAVHALLGVFLRPLLLAGVEEVFAKAEYAVVQLLFLGRPVDLTNAGDAQLALALQLWLRRLNLNTADHRLLVQITEVGDKPGAYQLGVLVVREELDAPEPIAIADVLEGREGEVLRLQALRDLALLAEAYPPLGALVPAPGKTAPDAVQLYGSEFATFLSEVAPALRLLGAQLLLPHGLERAARPKLSAALVPVNREASAKTDGDADAEAAPEQPKRPKGVLGLKSLVEFDWQVSVGDQQITADEFAEIAGRYEGIVRLRDGFVWLEAAQTDRLLKRLATPPKPSAAVVVQSVLTATFQGAPLFLAEEVRRLRENLLAAPDPEGMPELPGLQATLRPYQVTGFEWLRRNAEAGLGSLLADDMGLGKTLQTIALLEYLRAGGQLDDAPALIVLPTSLITNWRKELQRFAPELRVAIYHGSARRLRATDGAQVVLTSYGTVRSDATKLRGRAWAALVIDEAQQIKNPGAAQTEAVKSLEAEVRIALSGTPVENRLSEYWSVLDFANPGYLGPLEQFKALYADPIEQDRDPERLEAFRQVTAPFLLRRLKTDKSVIKDLPDKITQVEHCALAPEQAGLYQQVVETQVQALAGAEPHERAGRMLKFMTAVKQVCNHPWHYLKRGTRAAEASGKALRLLELTDAALEREERVLVFTQYRQMGELLAELLRDRYGYAPPFLHGGLSRDERDAMVAGMQDGSGPPILLLSIKAGGTGLNLTAANHVIHYDLWWNPAVESQATDRAFRIGQRRNVHVHRLICTGTFEERIDLMLEHKRELADLTVGEGGAWLGDLAEELLAG